MITDKYKQVWKVIGKQYGYPECCIEEFVKLEHIGEVRKLHGTGYIPCKKCNEKSEKELINTINAARNHCLPFPKENREEVAKIWAKNRD